MDDDDGGVGVQQNLFVPIESESDIEWMSCKYFMLKYCPLSENKFKLF